MKNSYRSTGSCIKIKNFQYSSFQSTRSRYKSTQRNPIRIVVDKVGENGHIQQQIIDQNEEMEREAEENRRQDFTPKVNKHGSLPNLLQRYERPPENRSHVFNRFQYDNYQSIPLERVKNYTKPNRSRPGSRHKNIETVFCENKFPEFVDKTNEKIEEIFKKEQHLAHQQNKRFMASHVLKDKPVTIRRGQKTSLASCLKQFATLEKLSIFMETDHNLREKYLCYGVEKDPSRTLLIDVLNHRFSFMKQLNRRLRDNVYRCLLKRDDIHSLTKINVQEYMRFYEMFIARDANLVETATFIYLILFGNSPPSFQLGRSIIQHTHGPLHKQRVAMDELSMILEDATAEQVVNSIANNQAFMRLVIDLIIQK